MNKLVTFWEGRPINELDRDELIEVIEYLAARYNELTTPSAIRAQSIGRAEMLRRGESYIHAE